jgi:hypothetical protein
MGVAVDSTVVRAHHHAAGARWKPPRDVPAAVLVAALAGDVTSAMTSTSEGASAAAADTGRGIKGRES